MKQKDLVREMGRRLRQMSKLSRDSQLLMTALAGASLSIRKSLDL
jgi:hypothetical protein